MYEAFYGFREKPFSLLPDPDFLYLSKKHRMALTMLEYGLLNQAGFSVITGEVGTGKTTLIRKLLRHMDHALTVGLISNSQCGSFEELLRWILFSFEVEYRGKEKVELYQTLVEFLVKTYGERRRAVLIIDEAQHLTPELLEELRMLSNLNADKHQVLQLILVGQPGLRDLLREPSLDQFAQRVAVDYHLAALDVEETTQYIRHRLGVVGGDPALFSDGGCERIWRFSRGVPRLINIMCDTALVYGFAEQTKTIDPNLIDDVVRDRQGGLAPLHEDAVQMVESNTTIGRLFGK
jgi:general secretion pathway protein A